jgi:hypothetical protein
MSAAPAMIASPESDSEESLQHSLFALPPNCGSKHQPRQAVSYKRGSRVYATDGPVGTLRQVVIDEDMGEVKALVVRLTTKNESVLVPPDLVDKCINGALQLNVTKAQFSAGATRSPRFNRRMFTGADSRQVARAIPLVFRGDWRRSVVRLSRDTVETSDTLEVKPDPQPAGPRRPRWMPFKRNRGAAHHLATEMAPG